MAIGKTYRKIGKDRAFGSGDILEDRQTDRQTDTHTDVLITILRHRSRGRSNELEVTVLTCSVQFVKCELAFKLRPGGVRGIVVSVSLCLSVSLSALVSQKATRPNFTKFSARVTCSHGSVLL